MEVKATAKEVRRSARKVRLVLDLIRGKDVKEAQAILKFTPRAASALTLKVLNEARSEARDVRHVGGYPHLRQAVPQVRDDRRKRAGPLPSARRHLGLYDIKFIPIFIRSFNQIIIMSEISCTIMYCYSC